MLSQKNSFNILFLYSREYYHIGPIYDFSNAFSVHSRYNVHYMFAQSSDCIDLSCFDAIIINYCFWPTTRIMSKFFFDRIADFKGPKIAILQDEYDTSRWYRETLIKLKIDCIVTNIINPDDRRKVYHGSKLKHLDFIHALTGYVPDNVMTMPKPRPFKDRKWFIGYRGRTLHFKYGRLGWEKFNIGVSMKKICEEHNIPANIEVNEESRIYGDAWPKFIQDCRVMLGSESGSNVFDLDGTLVPKINDYLEKHPDADFETVYNLFLKDVDGNIQMGQISPRVFESIALGTGMVLFEGNYSGVIEPWKHYIPLKKDFSNVDEVFAAVNNIPFLEEMTGRAYKDIIESGKYSYSVLVNQIDDYIDRKIKETKELTPIYMLIGMKDSSGNITFLNNHISNMPTRNLMCSVINAYLLPAVIPPSYTISTIMTSKLSSFTRKGRNTAIDILRYNNTAYRTMRWCYRKIKKAIK